MSTTGDEVMREPEFDARLLAAVLEGVPDTIVVIDHDRVIRYATPRVETLLGWAPSDLIGRHLHELIPPRRQGRHRIAGSTWFASPRSLHMGAIRTVAGRHRDGHEVMLDVGLGPVIGEDGAWAVVSMRDAAEAVRATAAMQMERDHVVALIDSMADGVAECERDGTVVHANQQLCRMVGVTADELIGPWTTAEDASDVRGVRAALRDAAVRFAAGDEPRRRVTLRRPDGTEFDTTATTTLLRMPHAADRLVMVLHDATEDDRVTAELTEARAAIEVADDRDRIARDLHDLVIQRLFAAGLHLETAGARNDIAAAIAVVAELDEAITEIRRSIFMLHRPRDLQVGLEAAMLNCIADSGRILDHRPAVEIEGLDAHRVPPDLVDDLVAVTRELLSNVARHAHAASSWVRVHVRADGVELTIEDDGIGIVGTASSVPTAGLGLRSVDERATRRGGSVVIGRREPNGTSVRWFVPHPPH